MQNPRNIVIGPLNVNCLKNKFEALEELIQNRVDVCFFSETIIDETFPNQQFKINGYKLFCQDKNCYNGVILGFINKYIPSNTVTVEGIERDCKSFW